MTNSDRFEWIRYNTRPRTTAGDKKFRSWITLQDWMDIVNVTDAEGRAALMMKKFHEVMEESYPIVQIKKKSTNDPWITPAITKRITVRKKIYEKHDRSDEWKLAKKTTNKMIKYSEKKYYDKYVNLAKETGDQALYYKMIGWLKDKESPKPFRVQSMFPKMNFKDRYC